jgi:hypothetical protein
MCYTDTEAGRRKPCLCQSRLRPSVYPGGYGEGTEGEKGPIPEDNYLSQ